MIKRLIEKNVMYGVCFIIWILVLLVCIIFYANRNNYLFALLAINSLYFPLKMLCRVFIFSKKINYCRRVREIYKEIYSIE